MGCLLQTLQWLPSSLRHATLTATAPAYLSGPTHLTPLPLGLPGTSQNYFIWVSSPCSLSPQQAFRCSLCLELIPSLFSCLLIHSAFIPVHLCRHWIPESPDPDSEALLVGLHFVRLLLSISQNVPSSGGLSYRRP